MSRAAMILACSAILMSCVVTRSLDHQPPPNFPPSVTGSQEWPTDRVHVVTIGTGIGTADGGVGGAMELVLGAVVTDPNLDDELEGLVFLNPNPNIDGSGLVRQIDIPASGSLEREVTLPSIPFGQLNEGECNVVELRVSRQFSNFPDLEPGTAIDGLPDLGVGVWFIGAKAEDDDPAPDMGGCQAQ